MKTIIDKETGREITISDESYNAMFPKGRWKPEIGETYNCVEADGELDIITWVNDNIDNHYYNTRNVFKTVREAEKRIKEIEKKYEILNRIEELNDGWKPDWNNAKELKFYFGLRAYDGIEVGYTDTVKLNPDEFYFKTKRVGMQLRSEFGSNLKYLFTL